LVSIKPLSKKGAYYLLALRYRGGRLAWKNDLDLLFLGPSSGGRVYVGSYEKSAKYGEGLIGWEGRIEAMKNSAKYGEGLR